MCRHRSAIVRRASSPECPCLTSQQLEAKAADLLDRLMARYPNRYSRRQMRTLQRRVRQWRIVVAKQLVYASAEQNEKNEADLGSIGPVSDN